MQPTRQEAEWWRDAVASVAERLRGDFKLWYDLKAEQIVVECLDPKCRATIVIDVELLEHWPAECTVTPHEHWD